MALSNFYLTDKGCALLARAQTGAQLTITRCQVCEGLMPEGTTYANITALPSPVKDMVIARMDAGSNGQVKIAVQFSNAGVGRPFNWTGYGLWAADPDAPDDRTRDILYGTAFAASTAESVPVPSALTEFRFNTILTVQRATSVTAIIDESLVYPTKAEMEEALKDVGKGVNVLIGATAPEAGPILWFNTGARPTPEKETEEAVLILTAEDTGISVAVDGESHNVENATVDGEATVGKYNFDIL